MNEIVASSGSKRIRAGLIASVAVICILVLLGYGFWSQRTPEGRTAPDFALSLFDGAEMSLTEMRGRVVVVNFWGSWCVPCRREAAALERVWRDYRDEGVSFVGVNVKDATPRALAFIDEFGITYPNGPDTYGRISSSFRVLKVPETFVIAPDGRLVRRFVGEVSEADLTESLDDTLQF